MTIEIERSSVGLSKVAVSETHCEKSPYFAGWRAYDENPYDELCNPSGVIQMGLAENQVSLDLVEKYLQNRQMMGIELSGLERTRCFKIIMACKLSERDDLAMASFMEQIRGGRAKFDPDRVVITAGATAANELLTFILADPGDALLIPTPYYPGYQ
ncbi:UNVERIFIED_CONTAM: 1-aminocyclopropane-1-carboxylate synthase 7 [Sesamum angustifolium]|uniref:1-aminocyclopropane-1-carboxylate synthase 7 n=1 Tax=Sesamum angustifolium TaxID=2727405 RepID=A0AAW2MTP2_9LAMI